MKQAFKQKKKIVKYNEMKKTRLVEFFLDNYFVEYGPSYFFILLEKKLMLLLASNNAEIFR